MAFDYSKIPALVNELEDLTGIPELEGFSTFIASVLPSGTTLQYPISPVQKSTGVLLPAKLSGTGQNICIWFCDNDAEPDTAGVVVTYQTDQFSFKDGYALSPAAPQTILENGFWQGSWQLYSNMEEYVVPSDFLNAITADAADLTANLGGKQAMLTRGLNLVHTWKLNDALTGFTVGPFANLLGDTDVVLLANEYPGGMTFTLLLEQISASLPDYLTKFLSLQWASFSLFYSFADEEFPQSSASLSAQVQFMEQDALLEVALPSKAQPEAILSLAIYPQSPHPLEGGLSKLFEILGVGAPDIPESLPALGLEMTYLRVGISNSSIDSISTSLQLKAGTGDDGWSIPKDPKLFTFYAVSLQLDWRKGSGISFTLTGAMNALSYDFLLSYGYPSQIISAQIAPGVTTGKKIEELATEIGFPSELASGLSEVGTAFDISMYADVDDKELEIRLQNHNPWKLAGFLALNTLDLRLEFLNAWSFSGASLYVELDLPIGPMKGSGPERESVTIDIEADYDRLENRWSFEGETGEGQNIAVGEAINALAKKAGGNGFELPEAIHSLVVRDIHLLFDNKGNAEFTCITSIDIAGKELDFWVHLKREENATFLISGSLFINGIQLGVAFESTPAPGSSTPSTLPKTSDKYVIGSLLIPLTLDSKDLISAIAPDLAPDIPLSMAVRLKGLLLGLHKGSNKGSGNSSSSGTGASSEFLFRLSFDLNVKLSGIPLIGAMLPEGIGFTKGQLLAANKDWQDEDIEEVNGLLDQFKPNQPEAIGKLGDNATGPTVGKGISLSGAFQISEAIHFPMFLHFGENQPASGGNNQPVKGGSSSGGTSTPGNAGTAGSTVAVPVSAKPDPRAQRQVGKQLGPVNVKKVELLFQDGRLGLKITGGLALATFEFELIGLSVTVPQTVLNDPKQVTDINFGLDGIRVDVQKGTLTIAGAFLRTHYPESTTTGKTVAAYDEYNGIVQVAFPPFSLTGMGSYALYDGHPSLFLFVAIGFPITVHPSLVIEGMSLGFGIHRDFVAPELKDILSFPLIQASVTPPPPIDIEAMVESLHQYFPPTVGQYFVVAGIKFKAFGLVDTLALLAVKFGREFEIDLMGVSSILLPQGFIELAWMARIVPDKGEFFIGGELTQRSYLLAPMAQLTGGFAVAFWTGGDHKGDFVVSVGGYHPLYKKPGHYPDHISRLGISFKLGSILAIKGGMYFAVTPQAIMMGGFLNATLQLDGMEGYLSMTLDAMIWYQPFHYDALIGVDAGVKVDIPAVLYTFHINLHLHLDVHVWGPEFSGIAYLDVGVKTFAVPFGAASNAKPLPVGWDEFKGKFLQTKAKDGTLKDNVCSAVVTKGLIRKVKKADNTEIYVVNPKELEIEAKTILPVTEKIDGIENPVKSGPFGITPMGVKGGGYTAIFHATLAEHPDKFKKRAITSSVPAAIWGANGLVQADLAKSDDSLLTNALTGVLITPGKDVESGETHELNKEQLAYNTDGCNLTKAPVLHFSKSVNQPFTPTSPSNTFPEFTGVKKAVTIDRTQLLHEPILVSLN